MRDEFSGAVKTVLAQRAAGRCSNPECGAVTSGPGLDPDSAVNVGVAAHITAASPGGPRYNPALTAAARAAAANGIWLCQTCAKLIDTDLARYTPDLLRQWKTRAEGLAAAMLAAGTGSAGQSISLVIPSAESPEALLSFASPLLTRVGRDAELAELDGFLGTGQPFAWWLWTGPAGAGKSRLAVELCRAVSGPWHAGFLREADQPRLGDLQALWPTLVVVDYAAQRAGWLSEAIIRLSQRRHGAPVRVLVLERAAAGPWWDTFRRLSRAEESHLVNAAAYALPRELGGLSRDQIRDPDRGRRRAGRRLAVHDRHRRHRRPGRAHRPGRSAAVRGDRGAGLARRQRRGRKPRHGPAAAAGPHGRPDSRAAGRLAAAGPGPQPADPGHGARRDPDRAVRADPADPAAAARAAARRVR